MRVLSLLLLQVCALSLIARLARVFYTACLASNVFERWKYMACQGFGQVMFPLPLMCEKSRAVARVCSPRTEYDRLFALAAVSGGRA